MPGVAPVESQVANVPLESVAKVWNGPPRSLFWRLPFAGSHDLVGCLDEEMASSPAWSGC